MTLPDTPEAMRAHIEREGVAASPFTSFLGLEVVRCWQGTCELALTVRPDLTQSHGTLHSGVLSSLADIVCGFAAVSQCGAVVTANVTTHMLGPARVGDRVYANATVKRAGGDCRFPCEQWCRGKAYRHRQRHLGADRLEG